MEIKNNQTEQSKKIVCSVWDNSVFILFMGLRFPNETSKRYIQEWKGRIERQDLGLMDIQTSKAYLQAITFFIGEKFSLLSHTKQHTKQHTTHNTMKIKKVSPVCNEKNTKNYTSISNGEHK